MPALPLAVDQRDPNASPELVVLEADWFEAGFPWDETAADADDGKEEGCFWDMVGERCELTDGVDVLSMVD